MTRFLFNCALALGVLTIIWMAKLFFKTDALGLSVTILIGIAYAFGCWELLRYRKATQTLNQALRSLDQETKDLQKWLASLEFNFQNAVRLRIEGARNALPTPVATPYLVGLLVMLGLLGTFLGMVGTLKGAVGALEGSNELEAIRAGLTAPIEGLGLAFGTSVAGVAASAMLGLLSTISRSERMQTSQLLDSKVTNELQDLSPNHQQRLAFQAIQAQAEALPNVASKLIDVANGLETMSKQLSESLLSNQEQFQTDITLQYQSLNESVDQSLKTSLVDSVELANSTIQPIVQKTLDQLSDTAQVTQKTLIDSSDKQLTAFSNNADKMNAELQNNGQKLLNSFTNINKEWSLQQQQQIKEYNEILNNGLKELRNAESERGNMAIERIANLESVAADNLAKLGQALEEPMVRLIDSASQTPKAAAEVIEKLRDEMSKNFKRDNELLIERTQLIEQLNSLTSNIEKSANGQRQAIDSLIEGSIKTFDDVSTQFSKKISDDSIKFVEMLEHLSSSSIEMSSLSEGFSAAVMLFSESNNQLMANLNRIEESLVKSHSRSDEQLEYYIAQAREIIDHNLLSQKEIINALYAQKNAGEKNQ